MKFSAIYQNDNTARAQALHAILGGVQRGQDLSKAEGNHPLVKTIPGWPSWESFSKLPLNMQVERIEYKEGRLFCAGLLVIDVEAEIIATVEVVAKEN